MQIDDFVHWTSTDEEGEFSHVGQVYHIDDERVALRTVHGIIHLRLDDGTFKVIPQPKDWSLNVIKTRTSQPKTKKAPSKSANPPKSRKKKGETKVDLVIKLLQADPPKTRKEAIERIVAAGISTPAGASTFYNSAKKHL